MCPLHMESSLVSTNRLQIQCMNTIAATHPTSFVYVSSYTNASLRVNGSVLSGVLPESSHCSMQCSNCFFP